MKNIPKQNHIEILKDYDQAAVFGCFFIQSNRDKCL